MARVALLVLFMPAANAAADTTALDRAVTWTDWNDDPVILIVTASLGWIYTRGLLRIWARAGVGRVVSVPRASSFAIGGMVLLVALLSPLDPLCDQLSSAHMVQHMLLMTVAAPLIVLGAPSSLALWGFQPPTRRILAGAWAHCRAWRWLARSLWHPMVSWNSYLLVMWLWHLPVLYSASLRNPFVHDFQHVSFFVAGCLFWRVLLDPISRFRIASPVALIYLFSTTLHATILGVFMTLADEPWYGEYESTTELWGLTALEDQQLAGLIMWMPACIPYLVAAVCLISRTLTDLGPSTPTRLPRSAKCREPGRALV